jgi:radical SAM protein with 4Fe4S-binding SPASM domain
VILEDVALVNPHRLERPLKITVSYTHSCNLDCVHCYAGCGAAPEASELPAAFWRRFVDERIAEGIVSLLFEGGEPLHRPDFLEVVAHCARRLLVRIRTNGWAVTPEIAAELKRHDVGGVLVDMMGARPETHDWHVGRAGAHARAVAAVGHLLAAGVPTQMLIVMTRRNVAELQEFVDLAARLGVGRVGILRLYPIGRARRRWDELSLPLETMMAGIRALRVPEGLALMQSWHPNDGNCCWQAAAVDARGRSIGCPYLREFVDFGNVAETPFLETWRHPLYRTLRAGRVEESCSSCSGSQRSHGGCRSTAYAFHGRWSAPDPFDEPLNRGVDLRELPRWMLSDHPRPPAPSGAGT